MLDPDIRSTVQSIVQSIVQSTVQSIVQSPGFVATPYLMPTCTLDTN